jgi:CheY-like chemotaxis protein
MEKINCILLVDDDQTTNFLHKLLIDELNITHELLIAQNGQEALEVIKEYGGCAQKCPSLILLDINMPIMNGFEFLEAYQQLDLSQKKSITIVMLTTSLYPKDIERAKEFGINGYLNKPLSEEAMKGIMKEHFSQV